MIPIPKIEIICLFEFVAAGVLGDEFFLGSGVFAAVHRPVAVDRAERPAVVVITQKRASGGQAAASAAVRALARTLFRMGEE